MSRAEIRDRALNNVPAGRKKMEPFYVSCEAQALSNLALKYDTERGMRELYNRRLRCI